MVNNNTMKKCKACEVTYPLSDFYKKGNYYSTLCTTCYKAKQKERWHSGIGFMQYKNRVENMFRNFTDEQRNDIRNLLSMGVPKKTIANKYNFSYHKFITFLQKNHAI